MKKQTLKVGDRVEIIKCLFNDSSHVGVIGKLKKINPSDFYVVLKDKDECCAKIVSLPKKKTIKKVVKLYEFKCPNPCCGEKSEEILHFEYNWDKNGLIYPVAEKLNRMIDAINELKRSIK